MGEHRDKVVHMIFHPANQSTLDRFGHGGYRGIEVELGIEGNMVAEDARERMCKKVADPLLDEPARPPGPAFKVRHDLGEEAKVTRIVGNERAGEVLIANTT